MKLSFKIRFSPADGTVYRQAVSITPKEFNTLKDAMQSEIALGRPRWKEYCDGWNDGVLFLKPLRPIDSVVYLNNTQARFINLYCKMSLKQGYNTCLLIRK